MCCFSLETESQSQPLPARERQQRDVARLLDGIGQAALGRRAHAGQTPGNDFARLGHKLPEQAHVLVIHAIDLLDAELANFLAAEEFPSAFARSARTSAGTPRGPRSPPPPPSGRELGAELPLLLPPSFAATGAALLVVSSAMFLLRAITGPIQSLHYIGATL